MHISNLIIELTRRCNMRCDHCLRGEAENLDMESNVSWKLIHQLDSVGYITFTGGEPTLAEKAFENFMVNFRTNTFRFDFFFLYTNGKEYSEKFMELLDEFYRYADEPEMCCLCVSTDQFHDNTKEVMWRYEEESEYLYPWIKMDANNGRIPTEKIIDSGLAKENGISQCSPPRDESDLFILKSYGDSDYYVDSDSEVYVSVNGNVLAACNLSYDFIDNVPLGNILNNTLNNIIEDNIDKEESDEDALELLFGEPCAEE